MNLIPLIFFLTFTTLIHENILHCMTENKQSGIGPRYIFHLVWFMGTKLPKIIYVPESMLNCDQI